MQMHSSPAVNFLLPSLSADVRPENRFSALVAEKGLGALPKTAFELVA